MAVTGLLPGGDRQLWTEMKGRERVPIVDGDSRFSQSGEIFQSQIGNLSDRSVLTVLSLTEELDTAIIFCGADAPKANFTLRIYCKTH